MQGQLEDFTRDLRKIMDCKGPLRISPRLHDLFKTFIEENLTRSSAKGLRLLVERTLQDRATRGALEPPTRAFIQVPLGHGICKTFMQGPLGKDLTRASTRSSVKDLYRIMQGPVREDLKDLCKMMQGPLRGCQQDLHTIFSEEPVQNHARDFQKGSYQDLHKIF